MNTIRHSNYPQNMDKRSYFSDVSLDYNDILSKHHTEMLFKRYQDAAKTVHDSGISYYSAELFNYFEEVIYKIGSYLIEDKPRACRPFLQEDMPTGRDLYLHAIWLSSKDI